MTGAIARAAAIAVLATSLACPAWAMRPFQPKNEARLFENAAINVFALPYEADEGCPEAARQVARELPFLIQARTLGNLLAYSSVGCTGLVDPARGEPITLAQVRTRLVGQLKDDQALMLVGGLLFEDAGDYYVQTFVEFSRKNRSEALSLRVAGQEFAASLPSQTLSFPPRHVTTSDLADIRAEFAQAAIVRDRPDSTADGVPMPSSLENPGASACAILEERDGWLRIGGPGINGWIPADAVVGGKTLAERLPELDFIEGASGYLRFRQTLNGTWAPIGESARLKALAALESYVARDTEEEAGTARAVALEMAGWLEELRPGAGPAQWSDALLSYARAESLAPYEPEVANVAALARLRETFAADSTKWNPRAAEKQMKRVVSLDPTSARAVGNLESYYRVVDANRAVRVVAPERDIPVDVTIRQIKTIGKIYPAGAVKSNLVAPKSNPSLQIDLNGSNEKELKRILGVSPEVAKQIMTQRPYRSVADPRLKAILGDSAWVDAAYRARVRP